MKKIAIYSLVGCIAFLGALLWGARRSAHVSGGFTPPTIDSPDSVQLAAIGVRPGRQLVAYYFGGSHCGYCQRPETKQAVRSLRRTLTERYIKTGEYASVHVVGVAIDDVPNGLSYLESMGKDAFDEISAGAAWQNEHVIGLIHRGRIAEPAAPLVIVLSRPLSAALDPLVLTYGPDSVIKVVLGADHIAKWVQTGADLNTASHSQS